MNERRVARPQGPLPDVGSRQEADKNSLDVESQKARCNALMKWSMPPWYVCAPLPHTRSVLIVVPSGVKCLAKKNEPSRSLVKLVSSLFEVIVFCLLLDPTATRLPLIGLARTWAILRLTVFCCYQCTGFFTFFRRLCHEGDNKVPEWKQHVFSLAASNSPKTYPRKAQTMMSLHESSSVHAVHTENPYSHGRHQPTHYTEGSMRVVRCA